MKDRKTKGFTTFLTGIAKENSVIDTSRNLFTHEYMF